MIADNIQKMLNLAGKQFLLLGITGEIGPQIAEGFVGFGATVHGTTIPAMEDQVPSIKDRCAGGPGKFGSVFNLDVLKRESIPGFVEEVKGALSGKPLDGIIVVVGGNTRAIGRDQTYADYADADMDLMMELNYNGPERVLRALVPLIKEAEHPRVGIIQTVSDLGLQSNSLGYATAKHAWECVVGALSVSLTDPRFNRNSRAFGVRPGFLDSKQNRDNLDPNKNPGKLHAILSHIPTHRLQSSKEIGLAIAMLCTPACSIMCQGTIPLHEGFGLMGLGDWTGRMDLIEAEKTHQQE